MHRLVSTALLISILASPGLFGAPPGAAPAGATAAVKNDWLCVPGQRVGPITAATTEAELARMFGPDNVKRGTVFQLENQDVQGTIVSFPEGRNNLAIFWKEEPRRIERIMIEGIGTDWKTTDGITVGTSLKELTRLNGGPFTLYGFEIDADMAGMVKSWDGGALEKQRGLALQLAGSQSLPPAEYASLIGCCFPSTNRALKKMEPVVARLAVIFP